MVDFIGVQSHQIFHSWKFGEFWFGHPAEGEEHGAEPNLLDVGLVGVLGDDLLDRELAARFDVPAQPDQAEPAAAQQLHLLETVGEAVSEGVLFLLGESERLGGGEGVVEFLLWGAFDGLDGPLLLLPAPVLVL